MTNRILIKRSDELYKVPTNTELDYGELAINYKDGNLFYKNWDGQVYVIASNKTISLSGNIDTGGNVNAAGNVKVSGEVVVTGNIFGYSLVGSVISSNGNILSYNNVSAGGNVLTAGSVSANANIWAAQNLQTSGNVSAAGNITGVYFFGNGSQLTGVTATAVDAYSLTGNTIAPNVIYSSLQTVGNLITLSVVGNVTGGNILTTGNVTANNFVGSGTNVELVAGSYTWTFSDSGNISAPGNVSAVGNIATSAYFIGDGSLLTNLPSGSGNKISNGNTFADITAAGANIDIQVSGVANTAQFSPGSFYVSGPIATAKTINHLSLVAEDVNAVMVSPVTISASGNIFVPTSSTLTIFTPN